MFTPITERKQVPEVDGGYENALFDLKGGPRCYLRPGPAS
jgi:hypothetical protein